MNEPDELFLERLYRHLHPFFCLYIRLYGPLHHWLMIKLKMQGTKQ